MGKHIVEGHEYDSIRQVAEAYQISYGQLNNALYRDKLPLEVAVSKVLERKNVANQGYTIGGTRYSTLSAIASAYGVDYQQLLYAYGKNREEGLEKALQRITRIRKNEKRVFTIFGKRYEGYKEVIEAYGVDSSLISHAVVNGANLESVILRAYEASIQYKGVTYPNLSVLIAHLGVPVSRVYGRLKLGWSLNDSLEVPPRNLGRSIKTELRGRVFDNKYEAYAYYGYMYGFVQRVAEDFKFTEYTEAFEWMDAFFTRYGGDRPAYLGGVPYVIYNGVWVRTRFDFFKLCGLPSKGTGMKKGITPLERMEYYAGLEKKVYDINGVGVSVAEYKKAKNLAHIPAGVPYERVKKHPECTYDPTGYCANISTEWEDYKNQRLEAIKSKKF